MNISTAVKNLIESRPLQTYVRSSSKQAEQQFESIELVKDKVRNIQVPAEFNGKEIWKGILSPVQNQGRCGSCWAFAATSTLADKFNIQSLGKLSLELSAAKLILCDFRGKEFDVAHPELDINTLLNINIADLQESACYGNTLYDAWRYLFVFGTNTTKCIPYDIGKNPLNTLGEFSKPSKIPFCTNISGEIGDMCSDYTINQVTGEEHGTPARFYKCVHFYAIAGTQKDGGNEENIRHDIYKWGPVSSAFIVYADFYTFDPKTTIYEWDGKSSEVGSHGIEIVGWGEENNKKFWWIKNSWGPNWGIDGYFKMVRGTNNCQLEENVIAGVPDFFYSEAFDAKLPLNWAESAKSVKNRHDIASDLTQTGGGIDPTTGYTRRVMAKFPWIDISRPLPLNDLPEDWDKFTAGKVTKKIILEKFLPTGATGPKFLWIFLPIVLGISIILIVVLYFKLFQPS